ncbi:MULTISPECIES: hypothetical protein [Mesotoga]|uniref:hypothetical protein n=1 Tax=Mesotoga TaxID=1184396 RepID=UPI001BD51832|nr:hypothetical protein [Mesotoga sp.]HRX66101.1 hypothetical protein [Mesotoga sp.]
MPDKTSDRNPGGRGDDVCCVCGKEFSIFRWKWFSCSFCGKPMHFFCDSPYGDSITSLHACPSCLAAGNHIRTYSANYMGKVFVKSGYRPIELESNWYKDKETALGELKILAGVSGYTAVLEVKYIYDTRRDGNYIYKIWAATGVACVI